MQITPQLSYETHQHGAAQARGEFLISTIRDANSSTTLPDRVGLYEQHGDHYHLEQVFAWNLPWFTWQRSEPCIYRLWLYRRRVIN
ncbi:hypothetical protein [Alishewanella longhuensis]